MPTPALNPKSGRFSQRLLHRGEEQHRLRFEPDSAALAQRDSPPIGQQSFAVEPEPRAVGEARQLRKARDRAAERHLDRPVAARVDSASVVPSAERPNIERTPSAPVTSEARIRIRGGK